jgi:hypothetical protein
MALRAIVVLALSTAAECFQLPSKASGLKPLVELNKLPAAALAAAVSVHAEAAHAKSVLGVNGALDFGPLAGDQPGGEGTGKVRRSHTVRTTYRARASFPGERPPGTGSGRASGAQGV